MATLLQKANQILEEKQDKILPANLKSGVTAFGVDGSLIELQGETKTITPTTEQQVITPSENKNGITEVTVNAVTSSIDQNIKAENIKKDVEILGIVGTLESGSSPSVDIFPDLEYYKMPSNSPKEGKNILNMYNSNDIYYQEHLFNNTNVNVSSWNAICRCKDNVIFMKSETQDNTDWENFDGNESIDAYWYIGKYNYKTKQFTTKLLRSDHYSSYESLQWGSFPSSVNYSSNGFAFVDESKGTEGYVYFCSGYPDDSMFAHLDLDVGTLSSIEGIGTNQYYSEMMLELTLELDGSNYRPQYDIFADTNDVVFDPDNGDCYYAYQTIESSGSSYSLKTKVYKFDLAGYQSDRYTTHIPNHSTLIKEFSTTVSYSAEQFQNKYTSDGKEYYKCRPLFMSICKLNNEKHILLFMTNSSGSYLRGYNVFNSIKLDGNYTTGITDNELWLNGKNANFSNISKGNTFLYDNSVIMYNNTSCDCNIGFVTYYNGTYYGNWYFLNEKFSSGYVGRCLGYAYLRIASKIVEFCGVDGNTLDWKTGEFPSDFYDDKTASRCYIIYSDLQNWLDYFKPSITVKIDEKYTTYTYVKYTESKKPVFSYTTPTVSFGGSYSSPNYNIKYLS